MYASNTKHNLTNNMAACNLLGAWPRIQNLVTPLHLIYTDSVTAKSLLTTQSYYAIVSDDFSVVGLQSSTGNW